MCRSRMGIPPLKCFTQIMVGVSGPQESARGYDRAKGGTGPSRRNALMRPRRAPLPARLNGPLYLARYWGGLAVYGRYHPASARRPASVILSHVTFIDRPPAWMLPGDAVASPSRTKRANISSVKPCASIIASVAPSGAPASKRSARCCSAAKPRRGLTAIARRSGSRAAAVPASSAGRRHQ
jgi:hypothetical protein